MVAHVTHPLHKPAYGRRMVVATALVAVFVGLATGFAGDFLMLITNGMGIGAWIASGVVLLVERCRAHKVDVERCLLVGGLTGGLVGLAFAVADLLL
jgi:hypothetical protein